MSSAERDGRVLSSPENPIVSTPAPLADSAARAFAIDPAENVLLEASAGTGKTRVLVDRYVRLLTAGVEPEHILAITFTRKAAAEMRGRIIERLKQAGENREIDPALYRSLRDRFGDIAISTIDAFCLSLVREFPLEADVEPGFDLADETEIPRLVGEALDGALRVGRHLAQEDGDVALVFVLLGERRLRAGLSTLLDRRLVAADVLRGFLEFGPRTLTPPVACRRAAERLRDLLQTIPGGLATFLADGPHLHAQFSMLAADLRTFCGGELASYESREEQAAFREFADRLRSYFLTQDGRPRSARGFTQTDFRKDHCASDAAWKRHRDAVEAIAPALLEAFTAFRRDLNVILSRGVWRMFQIAMSHYRRTLDAHAVLDFSEVLARALELLRRMDEFSRSRYKLESRYHHVLVDEFQDTSRAQWELVSLLVQSWGEGFGASTDALPPSIFIVGDRKQSIYGFRDAEVALLREAADFIGALRPDGRPTRSISVSFRSAPALLAFVNELFAAIAQTSDANRRDAFRYDEGDRFPIAMPETDETVSFIARQTIEATADAVAGEIVRLLGTSAVVRDRRTGIARAATPGDIAILFRSRDSHRDFERALERRGVATYVYKGLGFFDADEVQDAIALLRFLADPTSDIRAAAFMRSRIVRLSDRAVTALAPHLSIALTAHAMPGAANVIDDEDRRVLQQVRTALPSWLDLVDRITPAELLDRLLDETAYAWELRGTRRRQARENLKKLRALVRRIQNRGYATLARIADHLDELAVGDDSNAVIDAGDAVNLMTVHAAKGLEFPIVFVVNMHRGTGGPPQPVRVLSDGAGAPSVAIGDFESDADADALARDREETKRLLYVALTRARDRLYLASAVKSAPFKPGRGSLAEVMPRPYLQRFEAALDDAAAPADGSGEPREDLAPPVEHEVARRVQGRETRDMVARPVESRDDFAAIGSGRARMSVVRSIEASSPSASTRRMWPGPSNDDRIAGTLAHKLFAIPDDERDAPANDPRFAHLRAEPGALARGIELAAILRRNPDVRSLLAAGRAYYEVPFSVRRDDGTILRGSIDCLVRCDDGRTTVVELKTGSRRPEHDAQLAIYVDAARSLFPADEVEGLLVYAEASIDERTI